MLRVENCTPHEVNIASNPDLGLDKVDLNPGRLIPRARERTVAHLGVLGVGGAEIPVLQQRFTGIIEAPPYDPTVVKVVSHETIIAAWRSGRPIDDLGYPFGIVRDDSGRILGCAGLGMPERVEPLRRHTEPALTAAEVASLGEEDIVNRSNFPMRIYDPGIPGEEVDTEVIAPLFDHPPSAKLAVDLNPERELDVARSEQTGVPIYRVWPKEGSLHNFPENDGRPRINLLHPLALRHAAILGRHSLRYCAVLGGLLRDSRRKTVAGGRSIYVLDPRMLSQDGF